MVTIAFVTSQSNSLIREEFAFVTSQSNNLFREEADGCLCLLLLCEETTLLGKRQMVACIFFTSQSNSLIREEVDGCFCLL